VENTAKKWTKRKAVAVVIILGAADSLLLCLSILRERKKERKRERDQRDLIASLLPSVKKVPTREIKIGPNGLSFS
tara:strand:+ start:355 stop:582 length:228 start_codon:yes stop_codon:yes gene_type:complete